MRNQYWLKIVKSLEFRFKSFVLKPYLIFKNDHLVNFFCSILKTFDGLFLWTLTLSLFFLLFPSFQLRNNPCSNKFTSRCGILLPVKSRGYAYLLNGVFPKIQIKNTEMTMGKFIWWKLRNTQHYRMIHKNA